MSVEHEIQHESSKLSSIEDNSRHKHHHPEDELAAICSSILSEVRCRNKLELSIACNTPLPRRCNAIEKWDQASVSIKRDIHMSVTECKERLHGQSSVDLLCQTEYPQQLLAYHQPQLLISLTRMLQLLCAFTL